MVDTEMDSDKAKKDRRLALCYLDEIRRCLSQEVFLTPAQVVATLREQANLIEIEENPEALAETLVKTISEDPENEDSIASL